jgi:hypothetical protein
MPEAIGPQGFFQKIHAPKKTQSGSGSPAM